MKPCTTCNGSGHVHDSLAGNIVCPECRGTDWVETDADREGDMGDVL